MKAISQTNTLVALLIAAVAGTVVGWFLGSWTTCAAGPGCEIRLEAVNTLVGLVGGIGTFVTLLIGLIAFNRETRARTRSTTLDSRRSAVRFKPLGYHQGSGCYSKIQIEVTNQTAKDMMNVVIVFNQTGNKPRVLQNAQQVHSGRTFGTTVSAVELVSRVVSS